MNHPENTKNMKILYALSLYNQPRFNKWVFGQMGEGCYPFHSISNVPLKIRDWLLFISNEIKRIHFWGKGVGGYFKMAYPYCFILFSVFLKENRVILNFSSTKNPRVSFFIIKDENI